jgi:hypothetical protein
MLPMFVAVTGSSGDARFAVTQFSIVGRASTKLIRPPFESDPVGCVVACSGQLAAVGAYQQTTVWIYNLSNPANPTIQITLDSTLGTGNGIGWLSLDGTNLLVGQFDGPSVVLLDITSGDVLAGCAVNDFPTGITALALKGNSAIVSGLHNFDVLTYDSSAGTLTPIPYVPDVNNGNIHFNGAVTCDFDGSTAVVAYTDDNDEGHVYALRIVNGAPGPVVGELAAPSGVSSVTVSGNQVAAAAIGELSVALLSLNSPNGGFVIVDNSDGPAGGVPKFYGSSNLAVANNNGVLYLWSGVSAWPSPALFGSATGFGLSTDGFTTVGFTEVEQFRPLPIPPWLRPLLEKIFGKGI